MIDWCETLDPFPASALEREMRASSAWLASALVLGWDPVVLKARSNDRSSRPLFMRGTGNLCTADAKRMAESGCGARHGSGGTSKLRILIVQWNQWISRRKESCLVRCVEILKVTRDWGGRGGGISSELRDQ